MKFFRNILMSVVLVLFLVSYAFAGANTVTSSTGVVTGTDPNFVVTHPTNSSMGSILYLKYTKGTESGITLTFDKLYPNLHATDVYRHVTLSGTALSAYTMAITASGNYRIPIPVIAGERKIIVNVVYGSSAQGGATVVNFIEP
jgi:hypothetical protein